MSLDLYLRIEVDTGGASRPSFTLYEGNITHNLGGMARAAGVHEALWRAQGKAAALIPALRTGLEELKANPDFYKLFNDDKGWGSYENLVAFTEQFLNACEKHPIAEAFSYT
jgi:hypothetical protein